jgi:hypothetical protein
MGDRATKEKTEKRRPPEVDTALDMGKRPAFQNRTTAAALALAYASD